MQNPETGSGPGIRFSRQKRGDHAITLRTLVLVHPVRETLDARHHRTPLAQHAKRCVGSRRICRGDFPHFRK
jgi:hypothetical protein